MKHYSILFKNKKKIYVTEKEFEKKIRPALVEKEDKLRLSCGNFKVSQLVKISTLTI